MGKERWKHPLSSINALKSWWGVTGKKNTKKSKLIKKLKDDFFNLKKHYEQKITQLHIQLLDKEYYLSSILDFMNGYYHSPWDRAVYTGFQNMCFEDAKFFKDN